MQEIQTEKKNTSHSNQLQSYQLKPQGPVKENQYVNVLIDCLRKMKNLLVTKLLKCEWSL